MALLPDVLAGLVVVVLGEVFVDFGVEEVVVLG